MKRRGLPGHNRAFNLRGRDADAVCLAQNLPAGYRQAVNPDQIVGRIRVRQAFGEQPLDGHPVRDGDVIGEATAVIIDQ